MYFSYEIEKRRTEISGMIELANTLKIKEESVIEAIMKIYKISENEARNLIEYVTNH